MTDSLFITWAPTVCHGILLLFWTFIARHARALRLLASGDALGVPARHSWPKLSVLIPALNEEAKIGPALRSLLACGYPDLEVIVVNDRSTDRTGAIIDEIVREDERVTAIHIRALPEGWLGKVHALEQAFQKSTGEFVLCSDADVHVTFDALQRAVATMENDALDHLAILPKIKPMGFWFDVAMIQAGWLLFFYINPATIGQARCRMPMGVGAFNLVRGSLMRSLDPFKKLRLEVIDDIGLGILCHQGGGRGGLRYAEDAVSLEYYDSYGSMQSGMEKNAFAMSGFSILRACAEHISLATALLVGFVLPFAYQNALGMLSAVVTLCVLCGVQRFALAKQGVRWWILPFFPLGALMTNLIGLRSMLQTLRQGGIRWRGTFYPLAELRAMQVTKIPLRQRR